MPIVRFCNKNILDIETFFWKIEEEEDCLISSFPQFYYIENEIANINSVQRRKEKLATRRLLLTAFGEEEHIKYDNNGSPSLLLNKCYFISISHSKDYVALSKSKQQHGIDLEVYSSKGYKCKNYYLNEEEQNLFLTKDAEKQAVCLWACKEAVYKKYSNLKLIDFKHDIQLYNMKGEMRAYLPKFGFHCNLFYSFEEKFVFVCAY